MLQKKFACAGTACTKIISPGGLIKSMTSTESPETKGEMIQNTKNVCWSATKFYGGQATRPVSTWQGQVNVHLASLES